jgi:hypothetical protein
MAGVSHPRQGHPTVDGHALYKSLLRDKRLLVVAGRVEQYCQLLNLSRFGAIPRRNAWNPTTSGRIAYPTGSIVSLPDLQNPDRTIRQQPSQPAAFFLDTRQSTIFSRETHALD